MRLLRCLLLFPGALLGGCSGLLHSTAPALQLYVLAPPPPATLHTTPGTLAPTLRVARPFAGAGLNTDRIALMRSGNRMDYYAGSRWSAPLPEVLSDLQLAVLHADSTWSAVTDDRSGLNTDYLLQTSVEQFAAVYATDGAAPQIQVDLHCLLIRRSDGVLLGSFAVSEREAARENRMGSVVAAFSAAADRAAATLVEQSDELVRSAKPPGSP